MGVLHERKRHDSPLWLVFWVWGVLASQALFGLTFASFHYVSTPTFGLVLLGFLAYTVWILVAIWRHAANVRKATYGEIARYLTVAWAINSFLVSVFLFVSHAGVAKSPLPF